MKTPARNPAHALGRWGERLAARFLEGKGWRVLARGYRFGRREVDIIAARDGVLAFVEVKTRSGDAYGAPHEAVTRAKRREIEVVARYFLARARWRAKDKAALGSERGGAAAPKSPAGRRGAAPEGERDAGEAAHGGWTGVRFDVVAVTPGVRGSPPILRHFPDAWRPGW
ncbi:MAG: YraN family protein [Gemmatimonadota bacterium]